MLKLQGLLLSLIVALLLSGCGRSGNRVLEVVYVSAPQVALRDRVAPVYNKTGTVKNGDRVEVIDRERRFLKVRTAAGAEGWMEQRYVVSEETYQELQKLAQDHSNDPVQAVATTRNDTNIHLEAARDAEHLYQLATGDKVFILQRTTSERRTTAAPPASPQGKNKPPQPMMEDWWLVRDAQGHTGWVLARMVDLDVPLEVAQYAEGQRIQAYFVLDEVKDGAKKVSEYLLLLNEPKDGMPSDYNQARVFTWNVRRHRYETAYRERKLRGFLPATVGHEDFDKEGTLPVFVLKVQDASGNLVDRKYKLNTPMVRRVLAPGETTPKSGKKR